MTRSVLAIVTAALWLVATSPSQASHQRIEATYDFVWKGMLVSTAETVAEMDEASYSLDVEMRMRGLAKLFVGGGKTIFSAQGLVGEDGSIQPQRYQSSGKWKGNPYKESLTYDAQGNLTGFVKDWPKKWREENRRKPVPSALQNGHDPASLLIALIRHPLPISPLVGGGDLPSFQVFDGDTVINWSINCKDTPVMVKKSRRSSATGEAHECTLKQQLIAGERIFTPKQQAREEKKRRKARKRKGKRKGKKQYDGPVKVWMQKVASGVYWLPVRALVPSEKGVVRVYLKELALNEMSAASSVSDTVSR